MRHSLPGRERKPTERGFALLFVFALAASVAIVLYVELPIAAFEAQRVKEDILVERGRQYSRAIQLYFRRTNNYPPTIEALESTNSIRYLRRRYKDPLTGKDEWRLIHAGPGGVFTDSLVYNKPTDKDKDKKPEATNTFIGEGPAFGGQPQQDSSATSRSVVSRRRERLQSRTLQSEGVDGTGGVAPPAIPPEQPASPDPQPYLPGAAPAGQPGGPAGFVPNPGAPVSSQTGGASPTPISQSPLAPGAGNPALDMIRRLLTTPRPGGFAGLQGQAGGQQIGAGIAGVASKVEEEGIKVINERTKYNEWEFIYDFRKDPAKAALGMTQPGMGVPPGTPPPAGSSSQASPFEKVPTQPSIPNQTWPTSPRPGFGPGR